MCVYKTLYVTLKSIKINEIQIKCNAFLLLKRKQQCSFHKICFDIPMSSSVANVHCICCGYIFFSLNF